MMYSLIPMAHLRSSAEVVKSAETITFNSFLSAVSRNILATGCEWRAARSAYVRVEREVMMLSINRVFCGRDRARWEMGC